jgi:hypothetical protein
MGHPLSGPAGRCRGQQRRGPEPRDYLHAVTESIVAWHMLNMAGELITIRLADTIGPGLRQVLRPYWTYDPGSGDGIAPIPHLMHLETRGRKVALGTPLHQEYRFRLVSARDGDGVLIRAHLVMNCTLFARASRATGSLGKAEIWMALTRPFAPPGARKLTAVPAALAFLTEHGLTEHELGSRPIDSFRCQAEASETVIHDTLPLVYHMDRSDSNRHINMHVYPQQALDHLALAFHRSGGDVGQLRFRRVTVYFRRPFLPGDVAEVELDLVTGQDRFRGALRFHHDLRPDGRSEKISMALLADGVLAGD